MSIKKKISVPKVEAPSLRWIYRQHILTAAILRPFYEGFHEKPMKEKQRLIEASQKAMMNSEAEF